MRAANVRTSARRVAIARAALVLAFAVLAARSVQLSVFDRRGAERGDAQSLRTLTLAPERGRIVDRHGSGLALTIEAPSIYAVGSQVEDPVAVARKLSNVLGLKRADLIRRLRNRKGFQFVARWVQPEQAEKIVAAELAGVGVLREPRRVYPHRGLAARLVGFANIDGVGARGIEQLEDAWLRGTTRRLPVERDGDGRLLVSDDATTLGTAGGDIALTLDAALQADAERALELAVERTGARGGLVLAMDPHSGEVLVLAEWPTFDPNRFRHTPYASTRSAIFLDALEAGSAMKVFLVAAALEHGAITPAEAIDTEGGSLRVPGKTVRDARDFGPLDAAGVVRVSSNVGAVKLAQELGRRDHYRSLRAFGFGEATGSRFPDESAGVLRAWRDWKPVDHATIAFGQGVAVTPMQLAVATATIANGGHVVRPRLVAARRASGGPWQPTQPEVLRRAVSRETAQQVLQMMEGVVGGEGTGGLAALHGVRVGGKTGTAQKWDAELGRYSQERFRAWFVGVAPVDAPRLVVVTQLDEPKRPLHTGGAAAAPLFAAVASEQLARQGIFLAPKPEPVEVARAPATPPVAVAAPAPAAAPVAVPAVAAAPPARAAVETPEAIEEPEAIELSAFRDRVLLPDFRGRTRSEVMQITAASGLRVKLEGSGLALRQDPPPGSIVVSGSETVRIEFGAAKARPDGSASTDAAPGGRG